MSRKKISDSARLYLSEKLNCINVIEYIDSDNNKNNYFLVDGVKNKYEIYEYDNNDKKDLQKIDKIYDKFDVMADANHAGHTYFPFLYAVLNCHHGKKSKIYVFYEYFPFTFKDFENKISHNSEWYDIILQIAMINYYIFHNIGPEYSSRIGDILWTRLDKPYYMTYNFDNITRSISRKFDIVVKKYRKIHSNSKSLVEDFQSFILNIDDKKMQENTAPTKKILDILDEIVKNPINTLEILSKSYS